MSLTQFIRDLQKIPEAIPGPGAILYNALPARFLKETERKLARIITEQIKSGTIVDLGAGTGYLAIEIAKAAPETTVWGIDLSRKMVEIAKKHAADLANVRFERGNAATLPLEDNSVDFIVSTGSLHHWKKPVKVFDECFRVLKAGKEGWIFDGCSGFSKDHTAKLISEYGLLRYKVFSNVFKFHGFGVEEYQTKIKSILDQTQFKDCYQMEPVDMWMKVTIKKHR